MPSSNVSFQYPVVVASAVYSLTIALLSCAIAATSVLLLAVGLITLLDTSYSSGTADLIYIFSASVFIPLFLFVISIFFRLFRAEDTLTVCEDGLAFAKRGFIRYVDMKDYNLEWPSGTLEFRCKQKLFRQSVNLVETNAQNISNAIFLFTIKKSITTWLQQVPEIKKKPKQGGFYGSMGGRIVGVFFLLFGIGLFYIVYYAYFIDKFSADDGLMLYAAFIGFLFTVQGIDLVFCLRHKK